MRHNYIPRLEQNIKKFAVLLITNKRIFVAILGAYYLSINNISAKEIGIILLASNLASFIFEIPSGYLSDKLGHKNALIISRVFLLLATILYILSNNLLMLIIAGVSFSIGISFNSGTASAFMHDTLKGLGRDKEYAKVMGKISSIGFAVPILFSSTVPFLTSISIKLPFFVSLITDSIGLITAISLTSPPQNDAEIQEIKSTNFIQVLKEGVRLQYIPLAIFSSFVGATLFSLGGFRAAYQTELGVPLILFGVFHGIGRGFASLLLANSGKLKKYLSLRSFQLIKVSVFFIFILLLGLISNKWIVVALFLIINGFQWGFTNIASAFTMDLIGTSKFKATLISVRAQISSIFSAIIAFALGLGIQQFGYQNGFAVYAICFLIISLGLYAVTIRRIDKV